MPAKKSTNNDILAALAAQEDLMITRFDELTEKVDALDTKVEEMATRKRAGRQPDTSSYRYLGTCPKGRPGSGDVIIYESMKDETFTRAAMTERIQKLIDDGTLRSKRSAAALTAVEIPFLLKEGVIAVVGATETEPQAAE